MSEVLKPISSKDSIIFIKELIKGSIETIVTLRGIFKNEFEEIAPSRETDDLGYIFKNKVKRGISPEVDCLTNWLESVNSCINLRTLERLQVQIFDDMNDTCSLSEVYDFTIGYKWETLLEYEPGIKPFIDKKLLVERITHFVRDLEQCIQRIQPLAKKTYLSLELLFNDINSGLHQPNYFKESKNGFESNMVDFDFFESTIGHIDAGYITVNLDYRTKSHNKTPYCNQLQSVVVAPPAEKVFLEIDFPSPKNGGDCLMYKPKPSFKSEKVNTNDLACECLLIPPPRIGLTMSRCGLCSKLVHSSCYGVIGKARTPVSCYTCVYGTTDKKLSTLMRVRLLWVMVSKKGLPNFSQLKQLFNTTGKSFELTLVETVNQLFSESILSTHRTPFFKKDGSMYFGTQIWEPSLYGIVDDSGNYLQPFQKYFVSFSPKTNNSDRLKEIKSIHFPGPLITHSSIKLNLEDYYKRCPTESTVMHQVVSSSQSNPNLSLESLTTKRLELTKKNSITNKVHDFCFEDSLTFLTHSHNKRPLSKDSGKRQLSQDYMGIS